MNSCDDLLHSELDLTGIGVSALCVLHCLIAPKLPRWLGGDTAHLLIALVTMGIVVASGFLGFFRHGEFCIWNWLVPGVALLIPPTLPAQGGASWWLMRRTMASTS